MKKTVEPKTLEKLNAELECIEAKRQEKLAEVAAIKEAEEWPWKPKTGDRYLYVTSDGLACDLTWVDSEYDHARRNRGNCFPDTPQGRAEAERHSRIVGLTRPRCKMPKEGDEVWHIDINNGFFEVNPWRWRVGTFDTYKWLTGRIFTDEAEAKAACKDFDAAFRLVQGDR